MVTTTVIASIVSMVPGMVAGGTGVAVTVPVGTEVTVMESTGDDVSEGAVVAVAAGGGVPVVASVGVGVAVGAPGMNPLITTRMVTTTATAPVVTVTRMDTISASNLPDIVFLLPYLESGVAGPNQLSN